MTLTGVDGQAGLLDLTKVGLSFVQIIIIIAGLWGVFNVYSGLKDKDTQFENGLNSLKSSVDALVSENQRNNDALRESIKALSTGVVGKTPEGFHRRDCEDLVGAISKAVSSEMSGRQYNEEARTANETLVRALNKVNCYSLPGYNSRVATSRWRVEVRR